jgi:large subunit ribosomal protein L6
MSRIGKKIIELPAGVEIKMEGSRLFASGPKGKLELNVDPRISINIDGAKLTVAASDKKDRQQKIFWGTMRSLINNIVQGVSVGFSKKLEVIGVGYRVAVDKNKLTMQLGYSHPVELDIPAGLEVKVEKNNMTISGIDKQSVGQFSAIIRSQRPPEPYKGKGIKYSDEVIRRKAGKVMKAVGG